MISVVTSSSALPSSYIRGSDADVADVLAVPRGCSPKDMKLSDASLGIQQEQLFAEEEWAALQREIGNSSHVAVNCWTSTTRPSWLSERNTVCHSQVRTDPWTFQLDERPARQVALELPRRYLPSPGKSSPSDTKEIKSTQHWTA
jgi:hypothetical protein